MDHSHTRTSRRRRLGSGLLTCALMAAQAGCSQLYGSRSTESPRVASAPPAAADPYAAHQRDLASRLAAAPAMTKPQGSSPDPPGSGTAIVRSTIHPTPSTSRSENTPTTEPSKPLLASPGLTETPTTGGSRDGMAEARSAVAKARAKLDGMATYQVQLNRQERVGDVLQPPEDVLLSIRRDPKAVRLEWPTGPSRGREVIFSTTDPRGMLHVHMGNPLIPPVSMRPDSPLVMRSSRHPITEAGFSTIVENLEKGLRGETVGATIAYQGVETPPAVGRPCHKIARTTPSGELWMVFLDAETALPAMVVELTPNGDLLERYVFRDVVPNVPALSLADAFDPDKRWGGATGLLGRIARSPMGDSKPTATLPPQ